MAFGLGLTSHPCQAQPARAPRSRQPFPRKEACVGRGAQPLPGSPRGPALPHHRPAGPAVLRDAAAVGLLPLWPPSSLTHRTHTCPGPTALASPSSS